jgi:hypothetical protein
MIDWEKKMGAASDRDDQLLQEQAAAEAFAHQLFLDTASDAASASTPEAAPEVPLYERAIAAASARRGVSQDAIIQEDYDQLDYSSYPTPECLTPDEIESIYITDPQKLPAWAKGRLQHVGTCQPCRRLFASMHPNAESRTRFDHALEQAIAAQVVAAQVRA